MALFIIQDHDLINGIKELEESSCMSYKIYFVSNTLYGGYSDNLLMDLFIDHLISLTFFSDVELIVVGYITPKVLKMILLMDKLTTVRVLGSSITVDSTKDLMSIADKKETLLKAIESLETNKETVNLMNILWPI